MFGALEKFDAAILQIGDDLVLCAWNQLGWRRIIVLRVATLIFILVRAWSSYTPGKAPELSNVLGALLVVGVEEFYARASAETNNARVLGFRASRAWMTARLLLFFAVTAPSAVVAAIHGHMPEVIDPAAGWLWLTVTWSFTPTKPRHRRRREARSSALARSPA